MLPLLLAILAFVLLVAGFAALAYHRNWQWTGLPADLGDGTPATPARPARTAWDWLQLLIVPFVLALATVGLTLAQSSRDRNAQERRAKDERKAAAERAREDTLRTYLQQMSELITDHDLRMGEPSNATQTLARTLTLVAIRQLDRVRKGLVVQFLMESDLITATTTEHSSNSSSNVPARTIPRVSLEGADLRRALMPQLSEVSYEGEATPGLRAAVLEDADLRDAVFRERNLTGVSFRRSDLRGADFTRASIGAADYAGACLSDTQFVGTDGDTADVAASLGIFREFDDSPPTNVAGAEGLGMDFSLRPPPTNFTEAEGRGIDFTKADLTNVDFGSAQTAGPRLTGVKLDGARGAKIPPDWTRTGKRMNDKQASQLCSEFPPDP